ncbi:MAG: metallophosphoesterase [Tepidisphaeraceae bacterium]
MFSLIIFTLILAGDGWWWIFLNRQARRAGLSLGWRRLISGIMGTTIGLVLLLIAARVLQLRIHVLPEDVVSWLFIWHVLFVPCLTVLSLFSESLRKGFAYLRPQRAEAPVAERRRFLTGALIVIPPAVAVACTAHAAMTEDDLRIRRVQLRLKNLPPALDGLTIAQMTDPHLGSFMSNAKYRKIIDITNSLDADLVLQTGDLINVSLGDLPDGIEMVRAFKSRYGVYCCQGNHDVIIDREAFERDTKRANINMLLDEARDLTIRGTPLRLAGVRWWGSRDDVMQKAFADAFPADLRDKFTLMMAHHPHFFDITAAAGVPLTLSGHTHGGQLALTQNIGVGPMMYRYWSGEYRKGDNACFVSNGTGNWFPLRINVPCEIIHLTLRCAQDMA